MAESSHKIPDSASPSFKELLRVAKTFTCPSHRDRDIKMFCVTDKTFGCHDCMDEKPDHWRFEKCKTSDRAIDLVYEVFQSATCHSDTNPATHFCITEKVGKCMECAMKCNSQKHDLKNLDSLHLEIMDELNLLSGVLQSIEKKELFQMEKKKQEFKKKEIAKTNALFDKYIETIQELKKKTARELEKKIDSFVQEIGCLTESDVAQWDESVNDLQKTNKCMAVQTCLEGGDTYTLKEKFRKAADSHRRSFDHYVKKNALASVSFVIEGVFPDLSSVKVLSDSPRGLVEPKKIEEEKKEEVKKEAAVPAKEETIEDCDKRVIEICKRFANTSDVESAKREVKVVCEEFKDILKNCYGLGRYYLDGRLRYYGRGRYDGRLRIYDGRGGLVEIPNMNEEKQRLWNNQVWPIFKPYFKQQWTIKYHHKHSEDEDNQEPDIEWVQNDIVTSSQIASSLNFDQLRLSSLLADHLTQE